MSEHVPTTEQVEEALAFAYGYGLGGLPECPDDDVPVEVVRRWLAEYMREKQAEAWEQGKDAREQVPYWRFEGDDPLLDNPYRKEKSNE